jgi:hypothetical protein
MTQVFPNPRVAKPQPIWFAAQGNSLLKVWRFLAVLALFAAPVFAQDAAPVPAPLPMFHSPVATGDDVAPPSENSAPQVEPSAPASDVPPDQASAPVPATATEAITAIADPQPVTLTALVTDGGKPVGEGVVWRVFAAKPDTAGQLTLAAKSDSAVAQVKLPPGNYVIHAAYGRAQASDTLTVKEGANDKTVVIGAGGLRLNAAVTGDVPIPINLLHFDVFTAGTSDADRALIAQDLGANDILTVNAGTYHIVSYFGDVNAVVRADLRVEAGQLTDATLYHRAAQISFKLVSEAGGEAIADVDWTVKTKEGSTAFTNTGAFPSTVLQEGDYLVLAKRGDKVYNREFQVQPGGPKEIEVLTAVY